MRRVREQCAALAQHRSVSAARSTPTRAQRGTRPKIKKLNSIYAVTKMKGIHKVFITLQK
ncbi:MAG: hypothetical protein NZ455_10345 [Bacteroidia bacterium]|nr:hypothetical protein [Bacteroidia bacterium]MDW8345596.1 hypothetical protein [Bacteroidia bacterium]